MSAVINNIEGYVFTNGTHNVVVKRVDNEQEALAKAIAIFQKEKLATEGVKLVIAFSEDIDSSEGDNDELGIPDDVMITCARLFNNEEDTVSFDEDAVISGFNVQSWSYIEPAVVLSHMASCGKPFAIARSAPSREARMEVLEQELTTLKAELVRLQGLLASAKGADAIAGTVLLEYKLHSRDGNEQVTTYQVALGLNQVTVVEDGDWTPEYPESETSRVELFQFDPEAKEERRLLVTLSGDEHRGLEDNGTLDDYLLKVAQGLANTPLLASLSSVDATADEKPDDVIYQATVQDWNASDTLEESQEAFANFDLKIEKQGRNQCRINLSDGREDGLCLDLMIEVDKGRPAVHIYADPYGDAIMHVHADTGNALIFNGEDHQTVEDNDLIYPGSIGKRISP